MFALFIGGRVRFDYNVLNLQSVKAESVKTELTYCMLMPNRRFLRRLSAAISMKHANCRSDSPELPSVGSVHSIAEMIPEDQESKTRIIHDIRQALATIHFDVVPDDPEEVLKALGSLRLRANALAREAGEQSDKASLEVLVPLTNALTTGADKTKDG